MFSDRKKLRLKKIDNFTKFIFLSEEISLSVEKFSSSSLGIYLKAVCLKKPPFHQEFFSKLITLREEENFKEIWLQFLRHGFKRIK